MSERARIWIKSRARYYEHATCTCKYICSIGISSAVFIRDEPHNQYRAIRTMCEHCLAIYCLCCVYEWRTWESEKCCGVYTAHTAHRAKCIPEKTDTIRMKFNKHRKLIVRALSSALAGARSRLCEWKTACDLRLYASSSFSCVVVVCRHTQQQQQHREIERQLHTQNTQYSIYSTQRAHSV